MYAITYLSILVILLTKVSAQGMSEYIQIIPFSEPAYIMKNKVLLSCDYKSFDQMPLNAKIVWKFEDGQRVDDAYVVGSKSSKTIRFHDLSLKEGKYTCEYLINENNNEVVEDKLSINVSYAKEPTFENCPSKQFLIRNDPNAMINCDVYTMPPANVMWSKDGHDLNNENFLIKNKGIQLLKPVTKEFDGHYKILLSVTLTGSFYQHEIVVEVVDKPIIRSIDASLPYLIDGKENKLRCVGEQQLQPRPRYYWFAAKRNLSEPGNVNYQVNVDSGELIIKSGVQADEGDFICIAENDFGRDEKNIFMKYAAKPEFLIDDQSKEDELTSIKALLGEAAKLVCQFKLSELPMNMTIRKKLEKNELTDEVRLQVLVTNTTDRNIITATIPSTIKSDSGEYECVAKNIGGEIKRDINLDLVYPPIFKPIAAVKMYGEMEAVNLTCEYDANPNGTVEWLIEDRRINERDASSIYHIYYPPKGSILEVKRPKDGRPVFFTYNCVVTNIVLSKNEKRVLAIKLEEAFPPSGLLITNKLKKQKQLTFVVDSVNDGGLPIKGYRVKIFQFPSGEKDEILSDNHPPNQNNEIVINNLFPNKTYNLRFAALNDAGVGEYTPSMQVATLPESRPERPQFEQLKEGDILSEQSDEFTVSWSLPDDNGASITLYEIQYYKVERSDKNGEYKRIDTVKEASVIGNDALSYRLTSLDPDSYYKVEIRAKNIKGYSETSSLVFRTANGVGVKSREDSVETSRPASISIITLVAVIILVIFILAIIMDIVISINYNTGVSHYLCPKFFPSSSLANKGDNEDISYNNQNNKVITEEQTPMMDKSSDAKFQKDSAV